MQTVDTLTRVAWAVGTLLTLALAVRLWLTGLAGIYKAFFFYLGVTLLRDAILWTFPMKGTTYALFYMGSQTLVAVLFTLVIWEIYSLVLIQYEAIRTASRWFLWLAVAASAIIWGSLTYLDVAAQKTPNLFILFVSVERGVYAALVMLILLVSMFLLWFPVKLPRNVIVHALVFAGYFLAKAALLLLRTGMTGANYHTLNIAMFWVTYLVLSLWIVLLKPSGEGAAVVVGHQWNPAEEKKLLGQLRAMNAALARAGQQ